jgi:hypothetical protein
MTSSGQNCQQAAAWPTVPDGWRFISLGDPVIVEWTAEPPPPEGRCRVYWGSHGCMHPRGHDPDLLPHQCDCCECGEHHPYPEWPGTWVTCVARPPYYGPETLFYGEEAEALGLPLAKGAS